MAQSSNADADLRFWHGCDLVYHQTAGRSQPVKLVRFHSEPEERGLRLVSGEGADGDGVGRIESVILQDGDGAWLTCVALTARDRPNIAAPHSPSPNDMASMNA